MANEYFRLVGKVGEKTYDEIESTFINKTAIKLKNILFTDIKFKFSNSLELNCHRWVLAQDSQYFLDLFSDRPEVKEIDLSDNEIKFISKYETMVLYLAFLYIKIEEVNIYNLWYNIFDLSEYINSKRIKNFIAINMTNINYDNMKIAFINYETIAGKFYYEKIELFNKYCNTYIIVNFNNFTYNAIWIVINLILNKNRIHQLKNIESYIEKSDDSLRNSILFFIASKFEHKSTNTIYNNKLKDIDIRKLCLECQYILFDPHLPIFSKEVELLNKK